MLSSKPSCTTDELAYEAMRLIHAKNLQFTFSDGETKYTARFTPKTLEEESQEKTADQAIEEAQGKGELKNPITAHKDKQAVESAMKGSGVVTKT